jgi:hypothetical protein
LTLASYSKNPTEFAAFNAPHPWFPKDLAQSWLIVACGRPNNRLKARALQVTNRAKPLPFCIYIVCRFAQKNQANRENRAF